MQIYWILRDFCPSVEIPLTQNIDISKNLITEAQMCFNMREQTSVELLFSVWASVCQLWIDLCNLCTLIIVYIANKSLYEICLSYNAIMPVHKASVKLLDSYGLLSRSLYEVLGGHTL